MTKCEFKNSWQVFSSKPQMRSAGGNITTNQQVASSAAETVILTETVYGNTLDATSMCFRVWIAGEISSTGTGDCAFTLRYGTTDILELATVSLQDVDDKPFKLEFTGHILTVGATGKVLASAVGNFFGTGVAGVNQLFMADTANTGATVNLTADGSFNITADWDAAHADNDVIATHGWIEFYN